jgi:hypothetical protein
MVDRGASRRGLEHRAIRRTDDRNARLGVAQEILHLIGRVRRIDGDENRAQPQAGNIEKYDFRGFLRLNDNPVAGRDTQPHQRRGEATGQAVERCVTEVPARGRLEKQSLRLAARRGFNPFRRIGG